MLEQRSSTSPTLTKKTTKGNYGRAVKPHYLDFQFSSCIGIHGVPGVDSSCPYGSAISRRLDGVSSFFVFLRRKDLFIFYTTAAQHLHCAALARTLFDDRAYAPSTRYDSLRASQIRF